MTIFLGAFLAILAGFFNGTYAWPLRYINETDLNKIWILFGVISFFVIPWSFVALSGGYILISNIPINIIFALTLGGIFFGIGMTVFTLSLKFIGMGVSFLLNIGASTIVGSFAPILILEPDKILTKIGFVYGSALLLFLLGIFSSIISVNYRDPKSIKSGGSRSKGLGFGLLSGILTASQGAVYSWSLPYIELKAKLLHVSPFVAANIAWAPIFTAALIPFIIYFHFNLIKDRNKKYEVERSSIKHSKIFLTITIMAGLYFSSLLLFSLSSLLFGKMGAIIAWPIMMIFIIITSNFWGILNQEWTNSSTKAKVFASLSLIFFIIAVLFFSADGYMNFIKQG